MTELQDPITEPDCRGRIESDAGIRSRLDQPEQREVECLIRSQQFRLQFAAIVEDDGCPFARSAALLGGVRFPWELVTDVELREDQSIRSDDHAGAIGPKAAGPRRPCWLWFFDRHHGPDDASGG